MRVLMIEDNQAIADATSDTLMLLDDNLEIDIAGSLAQALQKIDENNTYDVALVDLDLPDASGMKAPKTVKSLCSETVVIVFTGNQSLPLALDLIRIGIQDYIVKSEVKPRQLIRYIYLAYERQQREIEFQRTASYDSLTGVLNRRGLFAELQKSLAQVNRLGLKAALCTLDIDSFKAINDKYGHQAGDAVLKAFTSRLKKNIRANDCIGRIGGDEFWVILNGVDNRNDLASAAQKLVDCCTKPCRTEQGLISFSSSVGIAVARKSSCTKKEWIRMSDEALYAAKRDGKNCWRFYSSSLSKEPGSQGVITDLDFREIV